MKIIFTIFVLLAVAGGSAQAQAQAHAFDDVPLGHWAYSALQNLSRISKVKAGEPPLTQSAFTSSVTRWIEENPTEWSEPALEAKVEAGRQPLTRFGFAVAIARWVEQHPNEDVSEAGLKAKDITTALQREFQDEIARIIDSNGPFDKRVIPLGDQVPPSPRISVQQNIPVNRTFLK